MKQVYPAFILDLKDGSEHPFMICVPDMDIFTEASSFQDAIEMARDAIGCHGITLEDHGEQLPEPSSPEDALKIVQSDTEIVDYSKGIMTYVDVDFSQYRRKVDTKPVRRNVSLPNWLDYAAEQAGINVSGVLQEALIKKLHLKKSIY